MALDKSFVDSCGDNFVGVKNFANFVVDVLVVVVVGDGGSGVGVKTFCLFSLVGLRIGSFVAVVTTTT